MTTRTYMVASSVQVTANAVSATALQLAAWNALWTKLLRGGGATSMAATSGAS